MLMNYIQLEPGKPTRMHFVDHMYTAREIFDPMLGKNKPVWSLVFTVDRLEGAPAFRTFSILSQNLEAQFKPLLDDKSYSKYEFVITKEGSGFHTQWTVTRKPFVE